MSEQFKKGFLIADAYEVQFFIGSIFSFCQSYRVKDKCGKILQLDLFNLANLPSQAFASDGELYQVKLCQKLQHTNMPQFIRSGEIVIKKQKMAYLAFNFISGQSLEERLKQKGAMSPYVAAPMIIELLQVLQYLHDLDDPVIHNNINPQNVILDYSDKREKTVLKGFEFARSLSQSTKTFSNKGSSYFHAAPELFNGICVPQSDLFAVGALFYHLIMGAPPWYDDKILKQKDLDGIKDKIIAARSKSLNFYLNDESLLDDHFKNTILKALAIDVEDRFQTAQEFIKVLSREVLLDGENAMKKFSEKKKDANKLTSKTGTGFEAIAGMTELKNILYNDVIRALDEPDLYKSYGITIPNGMLLYGPPGCGKTFIAEKFAEEVGYNVRKIIPSDIASPYVHGTQEKIGKLFKEARENAPTIIFMDEIDAIAPSREGDLYHSYASEVNELLAQMTNCSEHDIFIIAATNRPEKIDTALLRAGRIDRVIYLPPPDEQAREALFKLYLQDRPVDLAVDYGKLAKLTENYVSSDLKFLVDEASRIALRNEKRITMQILEDVIKNNRPSVTLSELKKYEDLKNQWDQAKQQTSLPDDKKNIGFTS